LGIELESLKSFNPKILIQTISHPTINHSTQPIQTNPPHRQLFEKPLKFKNMPSKLIKRAAALALMLQTLVINTLWAQDGGTKNVNVDIGVHGGGGAFYTAWWFWVIVVLLFIIIIVAISRGGSRRD
jgi:hypothetical protein